MDVKEKLALNMLSKNLSYLQIYSVTGIDRKRLASLYGKYGLARNESPKKFDADEVIKEFIAGKPKKLLAYEYQTGLKDISSIVKDYHSTDEPELSLLSDPYNAGFLSGLSTSRYKYGDVYLSLRDGTSRECFSEQNRKLMLLKTLGPSADVYAYPPAMSRPAYAEFMRGLFDADGNVRCYGGRKIYTFTSTKGRVNLVQNHFKVKQIQTPYNGIWRTRWVEYIDEQ